MQHFEVPFIILLIGGLIIVSIFVKSLLSKKGLPPLIAFILIGFALRLVNTQVTFLTPTVMEIFEVFAKIGVICLLFRIGLESDIGGLLKQLRQASFIWIIALVVNAVAGFSVTHWLFGFPVLPSMIAGAALTATSVGVAVGVWNEAVKINTKRGKLLIDVAELNDISGVVIMALIFAIAPMLKNGIQSAGGDIGIEVGKALGVVMVELILFGAFCFLFSRFIEERYTNFFIRMESRPDPMITTVGTSFIIAAAAGLLGFSVAIGAFFAGILFSRDPKAVKMESSFNAIYELFMPFFFIGIGLSIDPGSMSTSLYLGSILIVVAFGAMLVGTMIPSSLFVGV
jgi:Kef-type K+ transport system membrane component KefB